MMNQIKNGHFADNVLERMASQAVPLGDSRLQRLKCVRISYQALIHMMSLPSGKAVRWVGLPEGTALVGVQPYKAELPNGGEEAGIEMIFHHDSFPVMSGGRAPFLVVNVEIHDVEPKQEESDDSGV